MRERKDTIREIIKLLNNYGSNHGADSVRDIVKEIAEGFGLFQAKLDEPILICALCGKQFYANEYNYMQHVATHGISDPTPVKPSTEQAKDEVKDGT